MTDKQAQTIRTAIVNYCRWGIKNAGQIHYAQTRPMPSNPKKLPMVTDCSGFATLAYKAAGAPDPNGRGYDGTGYTGSLMQKGRRVSTPLPGDLIFYGPWSGHHVVIYMYTWHGAWVVCSHGAEIGPIAIFQHREELAQPSPITIRSYLPRR